jgi:hypothetical protein
MDVQMDRTDIVCENDTWAEFVQYRVQWPHFVRWTIGFQKNSKFLDLLNNIQHFKEDPAQSSQLIT